MKAQLINFVAGGVGSALAFTQVAEPVTQIPVNKDENSIIVAVVTVVGGLISTLLTNLLKKMFSKKPK